jgi:hypothetical protein
MTKWEYFFDEAYFQLWAVRPVGDKDFNSKSLFHVVSKEEAERLCNTLNEYEKDVELYYREWQMS